MSLMNFIHSGTESFAVVLPTQAFITVGSGTVYSGLKIGTDGELYKRQAGGGWSRFATWLLIGTAANYYVSRTLIQGALTTDAGAGPLQLNADRIYDIQRTSTGSVVKLKFDIASDVSGSPIVATKYYSFFTENE